MPWSLRRPIRKQGSYGSVWMLWDPVTFSERRRQKLQVLSRARIQSEDKLAERIALTRWAGRPKLALTFEEGSMESGSRKMWAVWCVVALMLSVAFGRWTRVISADAAGNSAGGIFGGGGGGGNVVHK